MKNTEKKGKKEHICVGLLAHVDAGKTTLAESILYVSGKTRTLGRVDHGNAYLDTFELERLIFSSFTLPSSVSSQLSLFPYSIADTPLTAIRFRYNICIYNPISFFSQQNFMTTRSCGSFPVNPALFSVVFKTSSCSSCRTPY